MINYLFGFCMTMLIPIVALIFKHYETYAWICVSIFLCIFVSIIAGIIIKDWRNIC